MATKIGEEKTEGRRRWPPFDGSYAISENRAVNVTTTGSPPTEKREEGRAATLFFIDGHFV